MELLKQQRTEKEKQLNEAICIAQKIMIVEGRYTQTKRVISRDKESSEGEHKIGKMNKPKL